MSIQYHQALTEERWQQFTLLEQMGNIGSEVGRTLKRKAMNDEPAMEAALSRALELFDLTRFDPKNKDRVKEISRSKEVFLDCVMGDNQYQTQPQDLEKYFTDFAIAARNTRQ